MANELIVVTLLGNEGDPIECTIADNTSIPKGTLMELTDDFIGKKVSGAGVALIGITSVEKKADDGVTQMACLTNAIVTGTTFASTGNAVIGEYLRSGGSDNTLEQATSLDHEKGKAILKAMETVGASTSVICLLRT